MVGIDLSEDCSYQVGAIFNSLSPLVMIGLEPTYITSQWTLVGNVDKIIHDNIYIYDMHIISCTMHMYI